LLLQKVPSLTPAAVQAALRAGAVDLGLAGFDAASGFGRLDAVASAEAVVTPQCSGDDECADDDVCTIDTCDPTRGCVSAPLGGADGLTCRLGQVASPGVCDPGQIDARTNALIAKRVGTALRLLDKASQVSGGARQKLLGKVVRQLAALRRRVSRAEAREVMPENCADTLAGLIDAAQALGRVLAG
jgi:Dictyostelium (slime mold) repeat